MGRGIVLIEDLELMSSEQDRFLIDESLHLKKGQKLTAWGFTLFFWGVLLYLLQPILSLVAWWLNINLFYNHMIMLGGYQAFLDVVAFYLLVICILGGGLIIWARVNLWRFKNNNQREFCDHVNEKGIHEYFTINEQKLTYLQSVSHVYISLNQKGGIDEIKY